MLAPFIVFFPKLMQLLFPFLTHPVTAPAVAAPLTKRPLSELLYYMTTELAIFANLVEPKPKAPGRFLWAYFTD